MCITPHFSTLTSTDPCLHHPDNTLKLTLIPSSSSANSTWPQHHPHTIVLLLLAPLHSTQTPAAFSFSTSELMYKEKSKGERTQPCRIPHVTPNDSLSTSPTFTSPLKPSFHPGHYCSTIHEQTLRSVHAHNMIYWWWYGYGKFILQPH